MKTVKLSKFDKLCADIKAQLVMEATEKQPMVTYTDPVNTYCGTDEEFQADVADLEQQIIDEVGLEDWTPEQLHEQMCMDNYPDKRYCCPCAAAYDAWRKKDMAKVEDIIRAAAEAYKRTDDDIEADPQAYGFKDVDDFKQSSKDWM